MLEVLKVLFCSVGAVYMVMRLIGLAHATVSRCSLPSPACELPEDDDRSHEGLAVRREGTAHPRQRATA